MNQSLILSYYRRHILLLLTGLMLSTGVLAQSVSIKQAAWDNKNHPNALYVRGTSQSRAIVNLFDLKISGMTC